VRFVNSKLDAERAAPGAPAIGILDLLEP